MSRLLNYFFKGLIVTAPVFITVYICYVIFTSIDSWIQLPIPGTGFVAMILIVTLIGFAAQTFAARALSTGLDALFARLPFVRLLYSSTRDLLNAFVGEQRRFDKPVIVAVGGGASVFGFLTQESLEMFGVAEAVTVYVPQSYGFAGNLVVFPVASVRRLDADSAHVMAFILSGGVTTVPER
ncbi:MAG: DUF502 domain-containing protein [Gemmatimonadota bacterium]|nr:DUF502 domain-containing protein [Gemmatimonadota bacterium]HEU4990366.1 DUF502 domain-containing protein [Gemmatimonadaceae bacterium]